MCKICISGDCKNMVINYSSKTRLYTKWMVPFGASQNPSILKDILVCDAFINLFLDISEKLTNSIQILNSTQLTCFVHSSPLFISNENFRREKRFDFC